MAAPPAPPPGHVPIVPPTGGPGHLQTIFPYVLPAAATTLPNKERLLKELIGQALCQTIIDNTQVTVANPEITIVLPLSDS